MRNSQMMYERTYAHTHACTRTHARTHTHACTPHAHAGYVIGDRLIVRATEELAAGEEVCVCVCYVYVCAMCMCVCVRYVCVCVRVRVCVCLWYFIW
jgi:hypothetical protein